MRRNDGRASVTFLNQALEGKPLTVFGDGSQTRSLCYVDDLIRGLYLLAMSGEHLPVNLGNPDHELTMLELAQACIRVTGSSSEIVFEALPMDDPLVRRPDITRARQILGWEPEIDLDEGLRRWLKAAGPGAGRGLACSFGVSSSRRLPRLVIAAAQPAGASPAMRVGIYDEAQTLYGPVPTTFALFKTLHVQEVRLNLYWGGRYGVARRRPAHPADPADPAYDWSLYDRTVDYANQNGVKILFSIYGTPGWANRGKGQNVAPTYGIDLRNFAYAAARRYSGTYPGTDGRILPAVRDWLVWNEPNNPIFLTPQYQRVDGSWVMESAISYAKICNAVYSGIHATLVRRRARRLRRHRSARQQQSRRARARPSRRSRSCEPRRRQV